MQGFWISVVSAGGREPGSAGREELDTVALARRLGIMVSPAAVTATEGYLALLATLVVVGSGEVGNCGRAGSYGSLDNGGSMLACLAKDIGTLEKVT